MFIKEWLYNLLVLKPTKIKKLRIYRPTKVIISKDAKFNITSSLSINKPWDGYRGLPSVFKVFSGATINCKQFDFHQCQVCLYEHSVLTLGNNSFLNNGGSLCCKQSITIGDDTVIGDGTVIRDTDSHTMVGKENTAPIVIGDHVWIGVNCIILKGVTIGNGAVVSAGSVVVHDIPPKCLAAGVPAKVIRENVEWER